uniref:Methyltransferase type 11 domain-containing protein n=1 Tax=Leersia perrieri TaxID=77586 RepID=A0A0D9WEK1_9ORYZ
MALPVASCVNLLPVAIHRMRDRLTKQGSEGMEVVVTDMLDLPFECKIFDLMIEKGTMYDI